MKSRKEAESAVDQTLKSIAQLFALLKQNLKDSQREDMIDKLVTTSAAAPDYKVEQIKSVLKNLYFNRVKDNFKAERYDVAVDCALKYVVLYDPAATKDKFQLEIDDLILQMRNKYYELAEHAFANHKHTESLNFCKMFLKLDDANKAGSDAKKRDGVHDFMLYINKERVKQLNAKQPKHPDLPASIYRSLPITKIVPRTPTPLKVTQSLNTKFAKNRPAVQSWSAAPTSHNPRKK